MPPEEKTPFAQALKIFSDMSTKYPEVMVIAIGATDTAREVVEMTREDQRQRVPGTSTSPS